MYITINQLHNTKEDTFLVTNTVFEHKVAQTVSALGTKEPWAKEGSPDWEA